MSETPYEVPISQARVGVLPDPRIRQAKLLVFAAAGLSFLGSIALFFTGQHERGIYVGLWVPSILSAGSLMLAGERHD